MDPERADRWRVFMVAAQNGDGAAYGAGGVGAACTICETGRAGSRLTFNTFGAGDAGSNSGAGSGSLAADAVYGTETSGA